MRSRTNSTRALTGDWTTSPKSICFWPTISCIPSKNTFKSPSTSKWHRTSTWFRKWSAESKTKNNNFRKGNGISKTWDNEHLSWVRLSQKSQRKPKFSFLRKTEFYSENVESLKMANPRNNQRDWSEAKIQILKQKIFVSYLIIFHCFSSKSTVLSLWDFQFIYFFIWVNFCKSFGIFIISRENMWVLDDVICCQKINILVFQYQRWDKLIENLLLVLFSLSYEVMILPSMLIQFHLTRKKEVIFCIYGYLRILTTSHIEKDSEHLLNNRLKTQVFW